MSFLTFTYVENTSESPTRTIDNVIDQPVITPGGLDPNNNLSTLGRLNAGSMVAKYVVAIEGCKYLLSDAPSAPVLAAWAGHDATQVLGGLFVELRNTQSIDPDDPLPKGGRCVLRVVDVSPDHADAFGIYLHKRGGGDKTTLTATADRNDTTLNVARGTDFAASGDAYVGGEAIGYTGRGSTTITGVTRGKYAAFGCDSTGTGGSRFARHHRVSPDINTTLSNPVVSDLPRAWIGKGVSVYLHTWSEQDQQLNTKAQAQLIYVGRIVGIADDPDSMATIIDVEHLAADFRNGVVGRDLWSGEITQGLYLRAGRKFRFSDIVVTGTGAAYKSATDLEVVASGASGAYQVDEGHYAGDEIAAILSRWLAQAKQSAAINGFYSWAYGVTSNVGLRSKCYWRIENANTYNVDWSIEMPGEVASFLGIKVVEDSELGQQVSVGAAGTTKKTNRIFQGDAVPYSSMVSKPLGTGRAGASFTDYGIIYEIENERGTFWDNRALFPASLKESCAPTDEFLTPIQWGLFLLDDKALCVASYSADVGPPYSVTLRNVALAPFQLTADNSSEAAPYIGRRLDESQAPLTIRQVAILEGSWADVINTIAYSSGTAGYNHGTYDTLPHGLGLGMPGSLLGPEWERSIDNLPGADSSIAVVIDEPTKFGELFRDDMRLRRAFIRWNDQGFEFATWRTPLLSVAQHTLTEANKAAPAGQDENHRIASVESDQWFYPVVKVDYARDVGTSRNANYLRSIQLEDQAGTDSGGNMGRPLTLKMRNTFAMYANAGAAVEELIKEYLVGMPMFARPSRMITRTIDMRYFERLAVGDICTVVDSFARDPLTGQRGIQARAGIVTRIQYDLGGPTPSGGVRPMLGEVDLFFLDTQRGGTYGPAAEVHNLISMSGYSAGYNSTSKKLWLKRQAYAFGAVINTRRGPISYSVDRDASWFAVGDKITVVERDPANTASPTTWNDTIAAIDGDVLTLTTGLASWDAAKQYRVFYQQYTSCTATQQDYVFQADSADEMIQDVEVADEYSAATADVTFPAITALEDKAEFVADLTYGDGKPLDVGTDAALAKTANALIDYRTKHQQPFLSAEYAVTTTPSGGNDFPDGAKTMFAGLYNFGFDQLSSSVTRTLTVAPIFKKTALGSQAKVRVTLSRVAPLMKPSVSELVFLNFNNPQYTAEFSQTAEWQTTSTSYVIGEDKALSIAVKDLFFGMCWIIVEGACDTQCRGLVKIVEGPRTQP